MLELTALGAFIAGLSTAFFGALVAGGAYLLKQHLVLREQVAGLHRQVAQLSAVDGTLDRLGTTRLETERLNSAKAPFRGDEPA